MYYKLGQACYKLGQLCFITNQGKRFYKLGQLHYYKLGQCYKLGQLLQIRPTVITKQDSYYKLSENVLQIGAGITNQGNYYKLGHSNSHDPENSKEFLVPKIRIKVTSFWAQIGVKTAHFGGNKIFFEIFCIATFVYLWCPITLQKIFLEWTRRIKRTIVQASLGQNSSLIKPKGVSPIYSLMLLLFVYVSTY